MPISRLCACGHRWEETSGASAPAASRCPVCGAAVTQAGPPEAASASQAETRDALTLASPGDSAAPGPDCPAIPGYELLEELGRGGMGMVFKALQTRLHRLVALKVVRAGATAGTEELERFRREAEAVAALHHANIVQIHEIGEYQGLPFFALEFMSSWRAAASPNACASSRCRSSKRRR
jgi:hypothetical protein